jgi:flagellar protein FlgJ
MRKSDFIHRFLPPAKLAGEAFELNPVVILAQAAIESGWGQSVLSSVYHNYFGLTAYGRYNDYWTGSGVVLGVHKLTFRVYKEPLQSFMDYARLISSQYKQAARMSFQPAAFAKEIAYSPYISEVNGDDREAYRRMLVSISKQIEDLSQDNN